MGIARNPITIGKEFNVPARKFAQLGVLDATLAIDTKLFIDPLLLKRSKHPEMRDDAVQEYRAHFEKIIRLLSASKAEEDPAWKAARKLLQFPEITGTCLGYGAGSIHGSGFGVNLSNRVLKVAAQIVAIGVDDPELFAAMALFESDIGPDRLSDMTTNIIFGALIKFNQRILEELGLKGTKFVRRGQAGMFLVNPYEEKPTPVILVPDDILRDLPIAHDWDGVSEAARHNQLLREQVNEHVASIWAKKSKRDKNLLKSQALASKESFDTLLRAIKAAPAAPYNLRDDPEGLIAWATHGAEFAAKFPLNLTLQKTPTLKRVFVVVQEIVKQFRHLVERKGLNKELYRANKKPRHESSAQRLFFAVAHAYCKANNVDVSPEMETGSGRIDFKFSTGFEERVLVEVKLSTNPSVLSGYRTQLQTYKDAEETMKAIYLLLNVGKMGRKDKNLIKIRNEAGKGGAPVSDLEFVDATLKPSASKRK